MNLNKFQRREQNRALEKYKKKIQGDTHKSRDGGNHILLYNPYISTYEEYAMSTAYITYPGPGGIRLWTPTHTVDGELQLSVEAPQNKSEDQKEEINKGLAIMTKFVDRFLSGPPVKEVPIKRFYSGEV